MSPAKFSEYPKPGLYLIPPVYEKDFTKVSSGPSTNLKLRLFFLKPMKGVKAFEFRSPKLLKKASSSVLSLSTLNSKLLGT